MHIDIRTYTDELTDSEDSIKETIKHIDNELSGKANKNEIKTLFKHKEQVLSKLHLIFIVIVFNINTRNTHMVKSAC